MTCHIRLCDSKTRKQRENAIKQLLTKWAPNVILNVCTVNSLKMPKHQDTDNKPILIFLNSSFCYFNCIPGLTLSLIFESFDGGRDSIERLTQGLKIAAEESPEKSLIVSIISIFKLFIAVPIWRV